MSDIFISYASQDRERVRQLAKLLEGQGWSVFWDRAIPTGMRWHEMLGEELEASGCVVVVWTESSIRSQWVYEEAEEGKRKGALFPIQLDKVLPPLGFRTFQVANLSEWRGEMDNQGLLRLLQDLKTHFALLQQQTAEKNRKTEVVREAEEKRQQAAEAAAHKAGEGRQQAAEVAEHVRESEEQRQHAVAEATRKAGEERQQAEAAAAHKAEEERQRIEEDCTVLQITEDFQHDAAASAKKEAEPQPIETIIPKAKGEPPAVKSGPAPEALLKQSNYSIIEKLGEGGMATVFRARHTVLEREVALKIMSPRVAAAETLHQSFMREARIVAQLEHPNIVRIYDGGVDGNQFYMAMELLPGGTLKEQLERGPLQPEHALRILRQIASALSYAHAKGYIHRDIKPANILFRSNGDAALADFGTAKLSGIVSDLTKLGLISGTPQYMSPEQATGRTVDQRSDIYSLGIVFFEMLTGKRPYMGGALAVIAHQHLHSPIPKLTGANACYQPLLERMLAKQPDDRFPSAESLLQALQEPAKQPQPKPAPPREQQAPAYTLKIQPPPKPAIDPVPATKATPAKAKPERPDKTYASADAGLSSSANSRSSIWLIGIATLATLGAAGAYYMSSVHEHEQVIARLAKQQEEEARQRQEQISKYLTQAHEQEKKQFLFDHSAWSGGCRTLLQDTDGVYDAFDSAEWYYRQAMKLDPSNTEAFEQLEKLDKRRRAEFSNCDTYLRPAKSTSSSK